MAAKPLDKQVSYHAFSQDMSECAISKNDDLIYMYKTNGKPETPTDWTLTQTVAEHGGQVSGIDWCPKTNKIVTCGHDRNAYVWSCEEGGEWKPTLVILRINRAATCVKWSPEGNKFAVGSGAKCVPVCHFEEGQNWWISKMIKKHKSSVLDLDWSPNQKLLVTGACDFKCRVFSAYIQDIDTDEDPIFGAKSTAFGECLAEFDQAKAWVQGVSFAPSGTRIAFCGHGSTLSVVDLVASGEHAVRTCYQKTLPSVHVFFTDEDNVVTIGFDHNPTKYSAGGAIEVVKKLDEEKKAEKKAAGSAASRARNMFQDADTRGKASGAKEEGSADILTVHKNNILCYQFDKSKSSFTTSGVDGRVITWKL